ncbi:MAG: hypothetical protein PHE78_00055 [Candidatus Gastranaerophilales bacterium]|nr:hypothetical protein [Candidatus Gastranaerophilales bacterium]
MVQFGALTSARIASTTLVNASSVTGKKGDYDQTFTSRQTGGMDEVEFSHSYETGTIGNMPKGLDFSKYQKQDLALAGHGPGGIKAGYYEMTDTLRNGQAESTMCYADCA